MLENRNNGAEEASFRHIFRAKIAKNALSTGPGGPAGPEIHEQCYCFEGFGPPRNRLPHGGLTNDSFSNGARRCMAKPNPTEASISV